MIMPVEYYWPQKKASVYQQTLFIPIKECNPITSISYGYQTMVHHFSVVVIFAYTN